MIIIYVLIKWFSHVIEDYAVVRGWRVRRLKEKGFSSHIDRLICRFRFLEGAGLIWGIIPALDGGDI